MLSPFTEGSDSTRFYQIYETCLKKMVLLGSGKVTREVLFHFIYVKFFMLLPGGVFVFLAIPSESEKNPGGYRQDAAALWGCFWR
jgi:hypothetical protein